MVYILPVSESAKSGSIPNYLNIFGDIATAVIQAKIILPNVANMNTRFTKKPTFSPYKSNIIVA